jgi:hypothetical protein
LGHPSPQNRLDPRRLIGPGRQTSVALRYAPLVRIARQLPPMAGCDDRMSTLFSLWRANARRENSAISSPAGTDSLGF